MTLVVVGVVSRHWVEGKRRCLGPMKGSNSDDGLTSIIIIASYHALEYPIPCE